jgi:hypothetical protein
MPDIWIPATQEAEMGASLGHFSSRSTHNTVRPPSLNNNDDNNNNSNNAFITGNIYFVNKYNNLSWKDLAHWIRKYAYKK